MIKRSPFPRGIHLVHDFSPKEYYFKTCRVLLAGRLEYFSSLSLLLEIPIESLCFIVEAEKGIPSQFHLSVPVRALVVLEDHIDPRKFRDFFDYICLFGRPSEYEKRIIKWNPNARLLEYDLQ